MINTSYTKEFLNSLTDTELENLYKQKNSSSFSKRFEKGLIFSLCSERHRRA